MKKTLKICAVFLLCALLAGCTAKDGTYYSYRLEHQEKTKKQMEENRASYKGKTVEMIFDFPDHCTLSNTEGQTLDIDDNGARGNLLYLNRVSYSDGIHNKFPYSDSLSILIPADRAVECYGFQVLRDSIHCYIDGCGATKISITDLKRYELEGDGAIETISCARTITGDRGIGLRSLALRGNGNKHVTVEFTETGAIATGFEGICEIRYFTVFVDNDVHLETTYTCDGGTFEVDVVSQPGEILVTPIEG